MKKKVKWMLILLCISIISGICIENGIAIFKYQKASNFKGKQEVQEEQIKYKNVECRDGRYVVPKKGGTITITTAGEYVNKFTYYYLTKADFQCLLKAKIENGYGNIMLKEYKEDIKSFIDHDPAAHNPLEIILLYPGFKALRSHKKANWCLRHNMPFLARWISQRSAHKTGIEIHPGATIGKRVVIDHGHGIVIGETAEIGDDVMIYQGVTLGGTGKDIGKRHPTIESGVMIGAGAKVLGPITVGKNSKVAAGAVVVKDVEPNCTVVGVPGYVVKIDGEPVDDLDQIHIPDPLMNAIKANEAKIEELQKEIKALEEIRNENI